MGLDYTLGVDITGNADGLKNSIETAKKAVSDFETKTQSMSEKLVSIGDKMTKVGAKWSLALTTPIVYSTKKMITAASDYEENINKIDVAFGKSGDAVKKWGDTAIENFGLSKNQALEAAALFGDMGTAMGLTQAEAAEMSISLASLAGDLASFKNVGVSQVMTGLKGVFTGETESIKELGIVMTETNLSEFASKIGKVYKNMSQAEKVQLRYNYVMAQSKNAIGDYKRTADGTANSLRTFQGNIENLGIAFGEELLPVINPLIVKATNFVKKLGGISSATKQTILKVGGLVAAMGPLTVIFGKTTTLIGKGIQSYQKFTTVLNTVGTRAVEAGGKISKLGFLASVTPAQIGVCVGAIGGLVYMFKKMSEGAQTATSKAKDFAKSCTERVSSVQAEANQLGVLYNRLEYLSGIENKNTAQKKLMQSTVEQLNKSVDGLNLKYDEETDKLNQSTEAIKKKVEARKQEMLQEAYLENSEEALKKYAKLQGETADLETQRADALDKVTNALKNNSSLTDFHGETLVKAKQELAEINAKIRDNASAMWESMKTATKYQNLATMQTSAWKELGLNIPKSLAQGINEGKYVVPQSVEELNALVKFDSAVSKAGLSGSAITKQLQVAMANGTVGVQEATTRLNSIITLQQAVDKVGLQGNEIIDNLYLSMANGTIDVQTATQRINDVITFWQAAKNAGVEGKDVTEALAMGIASGEIDAKTAAKNLSTATKKSIKLKDGGYSEGENLGKGVASGMKSKTVLEKIGSAAQFIIDKAKGALRKAGLIKSPSRLMRDEVGIYLTQGIAVGQLKAIDDVRKASEKVINEAQKAMAKPIGTDFSYVANRSITQDVALRYANSGINPTTGESGATNGGINQTINIYQPVKTPAETARAIRKQATFGLAGA